MENRIIIFEDNQADWSCIKSMLEARGLNNFYPVKDRDFRELKNCLEEFDSSIPKNKALAREFISNLIKKSDFLLMDYILKIDDTNINCIKIYMDLNFENKALIYTGQISRHYKSIEDEIEEKKLSDRIKVAMKPDLEAVCEIKEDIDFLCDQIKAANNSNDDKIEKVKPIKHNN